MLCEEVRSSLLHSWTECIIALVGVWWKRRPTGSTPWGPGFDPRIWCGAGVSMLGSVVVVTLAVLHTCGIAHCGIAHCGIAVMHDRVVRVCTSSIKLLLFACAVNTQNVSRYVWKRRKGLTKGGWFTFILCIMFPLFGLEWHLWLGALLLTFN